MRASWAAVCSCVNHGRRGGSHRRTLRAFNVISTLRGGLRRGGRGLVSAIAHEGTVHLLRQDQLLDELAPSVVFHVVCHVYGLVQRFPVRFSANIEVSPQEELF